MIHRSALVLLVLSAVAVAPTVAQREEIIDFTDQISSSCELIGLIALPPPGWFNVPIESPLESLVGCQMMRTNENEELVGILRLLSTEVAVETPEETWFAELMGLEIAWLEEMGITLGATLWRRDDVPVAGPGFDSGRAIGLEAVIDGNEVPQEVHFLGFGGPTLKYLLTLSTPARSVADGVYYDRNTADFGALIRSLQLPEDD
jgi:hypothetical protein